LDSLYLRRNQYWVKFRLPAATQPCRLSLGTADVARARLFCEKIELLIGLLELRIASVDLPEMIQTLLRPNSNVLEPDEGNVIVAPKAVKHTLPSPPVEKVLAEYLAFIKSEDFPPPCRQ
jgi:hypothetical protein